MMRLTSLELARFVDKIQFTDSCWLWTAATSRGYATFGFRNKIVSGHRFSYEAFVCSIPKGLHIDHLCEVRRCVNPDHLEAVTQRVNNRRMQGWTLVEGLWYCDKGHALTKTNLYINTEGRSLCKRCLAHARLMKEISL